MDRLLYRRAWRIRLDQSGNHPGSDFDDVDEPKNKLMLLLMDDEQPPLDADRRFLLTRVSGQAVSDAEGIDWPRHL
jgi:hypothetical protein